MALSENAKTRLDHALTQDEAGQEVADQLDKSEKLSDQLTSKQLIVATRLATAADTTTDAAAMGAKVDDIIIEILDADQTVETVVTDGEKPTAATIGSLLMLLRNVES